MLYFKKISEIDDLETQKIIWIELHVFGITDDIIEKVKKIDGDNYDKECFGICVMYDINASQFYVCGKSPGVELFYVDNIGNKHWFPYQLNEMEKYIMFSKCIEEIEQNKF